MATPYHVVAESVRQVAHKHTPASKLDYHAQKLWKAEVFRKTVDCVEKGQYKAYSHTNQYVALPKPNADATVGYIFSKMPHKIPRSALTSIDSASQIQTQNSQTASSAASAAASSSSSISNKKEEEQEQKRENSPSQDSEAPSSVSSSQQQESSSSKAIQQQKQQTNSSNNKKKEQKGPPHFPKIVCYKGDCLDAARDLFVLYQSPPLVMNLASAGTPGGGVTRGSSAQEETICRRTDLIFYIDKSMGMLKQNFYPLHPKNTRENAITGLYSPGVSVFRSDFPDNYAFLPSPFTIHVGSVAATNRPALTYDGQKMLPEPTAAMLTSLRTFFRMATTNGIKSVVCGCLGCGAFRVPASHCAQLTMQVIQEECADSSLDEVRFGIYDDHNALRPDNGGGEGNFAPFARAALNSFGVENVKVIDGDTNTDITQEFAKLQMTSKQ